MGIDLENDTEMCKNENRSVSTQSRRKDEEALLDIFCTLIVVIVNKERNVH